MSVKRSGRKGLFFFIRHLGLPAGELAALEDQLDAAAGDTARRTERPSGCYTFAIEAAGIDVELDQISIEDVSPELRELVTTLERLSSP